MQVHHQGNTKKSIGIDQEHLLDADGMETNIVTLDEVLEEAGPERVLNNWQCGECGQIFDIECDLEKHMEQKHVAIVKNVKETPVTAENYMQCDICGKVCENECHLKKHMSDEHREDETVQEEGRLVQDKCRECIIKENRSNENEDELKAVKKELDTLKRRHEQLKAKYEQVIKSDKENSKKLFDTLKENTELKEKAKSDAETLTDTLSVNQILREEMKTKDAIIETNDKIRNDEASGWTNCTKCEWKSKNSEMLPAHMLKHIEQYSCQECRMEFENENDLKKHTEMKHVTISAFKCDECDKTFPTEASLRQHKSSKHKNNNRLPIGHAEWVRADRNETQTHKAFACTDCGQKFASIHEISEHVKEHTGETHKYNSFKKVNKSCRYFKRGYCAKGDKCTFSHKESQSTYYTPTCNKGSQCLFLQQNRCRFYHPGVGVQKPREGPYSQGFRSGMKSAWPPMNMRNVKVWMD